MVRSSHPLAGRWRGRSSDPQFSPRLPSRHPQRTEESAFPRYVPAASSAPLSALKRDLSRRPPTQTGPSDSELLIATCHQQFSFSSLSPGGVTVLKKARSLAPAAPSIDRLVAPAFSPKPFRMRTYAKSTRNPFRMNSSKKPVILTPLECALTKKPGERVLFLTAGRPALY